MCCPSLRLDGREKPLLRLLMTTRKSFHGRTKRTLTKFPSNSERFIAVYPLHLYPRLTQEIDLQRQLAEEQAREIMKMPDYQHYTRVLHDRINFVEMT